MEKDTRIGFSTSLALRRGFLLLGMVYLCLSLASPASAQYSQTLPWNYTIGDPSTLSGYFKGQIQLTGDQNGAAVTAQADCGGSILGNNIDLLSISGAVNAAESGTMSANVGVNVLGYSVYNPSWSGNASFSASDKVDYSKGVDYSTIFFIGPIPINVSLGANAGLGLKYDISFAPGNAHGTLEPYCFANVYASASVDLLIVDAGIDANLTLINFSLPATGNAYLAPNTSIPTPSWGVAWNYNISDTLILLSGSVDVFAHIYYPCFDPWPDICEDDESATLVSFSGINLSGTLFADSGWFGIGIPVAQISSLSPNSAKAGSSGFTLTVIGAGFKNGSTVNWNGSPLPTSYVSSNQLTATVPGNQLSAMGSASVTVVDPPPLGSTSNPMTFTITYPPPTIGRLNPGGATASGPTFPLEVDGSGFLNGAVVNWTANGTTTPLPTTFVSDQELTVNNVPLSLIANAGTASITVVNPNGYGTSNAMIFPIFTPFANLTRIRPWRAWPMSAGFTLHVHGSGFLPGSTVYWNGSPLNTTYVSGLDLDADVGAALLAQQGVAAVTVINPPVNGANSLPSNSKPFSIAPLQFTVTGLGSATTNAVNTNGQVVGQSNGHAFLWSSQNGMQQLDSNTTGVVSSSASGINSAGQVVGTVNTGIFPTYAFLWDSQHGLQHIGANTYNANGINDITQIVGYGQNGAFLWQNNLIKYLGGLAGGGSGPAWGINNAGAGQVVGEAVDANLNIAAFFWDDPNQGMINLDPNGHYSQARAINDYGAIAGWYSGTTVNGSPLYHTAIWQPNGSTTWQIFDPNPNSTSNSYAYGINDNGDVVGADDAHGAVLYSGGQTYYLNSLLAGGSGINLSAATGISDGELIVANDSNSGQAYLLTPVGSTGLPPDPPPTLTSLRPNSATRGVNGLPITLIGSGFVPGTQAYWNGVAISTTYVSSTKITATVPAADLTVAGTAAVVAIDPGGEWSNELAFTINNPHPVLLKLLPSSAAAGGSSFTLTLSGSGFVPETRVAWNGVAISTTYVSANTLTATVPAADLTTPGLITVTAVTPSPGGGSSNALLFHLGAPMPKLSSLQPSKAVMGAAAFTLTVKGSGFDSSSRVTWKGTALTTTYISANQLSAAVPASLLSSSGSAAVQVVDSIPGSLSSNVLYFTVLTPKPSLSNLSPKSAQAHSGDFTLSVKGSGFVSGAQIFWNGTSLPTTYVSSSQLIATVSASALQIARTVQVTVGNLPPSVGRSGALSFTITPAAHLAQLTPNAAAAGGASFTLTAAGVGFVQGSSLTWNGTALATTYVSSQQLTASVPASDIATAGTSTVQVAQPGGGASNSLPFSIYSSSVPVPTISSLNPSSATAGGASFTLLVNGSGFVSGSVVNWNGTALASFYQSSTQLTAHVPASEIATAGTVSIQVVNPGPGGGSSNTAGFSVH